VIVFDQHNGGCAWALRLNDHGYLVPITKPLGFV
jgi:hypothetical protein